MLYPLTVRMCAERAGVSPGTIRGALKRGQLKGRQFGRRRRWKVSTEDFREWCRNKHALKMRSQRRKPDPERDELEAQQKAQERALRRFVEDGDEQGAAVVARALLATVAQLEDER
jgi:hypothetical protein